jgi:hypothetical protein
MDMDQVVEKIAKAEFGVETMETRKRDSLDFYSVSISTIKYALEQAYKAGLSAAKEVKEEAPIAALFKAPSKDSKRMRELAGLPGKGNYV